jgi:putative transcriptional regulator
VLSEPWFERARRHAARVVAAGAVGALLIATCASAARARELKFAPVEEAAEPVLLVASPTMRDPEFVRTVVAVGFPPDVGAMGVILDRPAGTTLGQVLGSVQPEVATRADPLWLGGPVQQDGLVFVFRAAEHPVVALPMGDDCYLSGDGALYRQLLARAAGPGATDDPPRHRFFLGFAQWSIGQLDAEIARGDWWVLPMDTRVLFDVTAQDLWRSLIERARNPSASLDPSGLPGPLHVAARHAEPRGSARHAARRSVSAAPLSR